MIKGSFDNDKGSVVQRFSKSGTKSRNKSLVIIYNLLCCQLCPNIGLVLWIQRCHTFSCGHYASSAWCIVRYTVYHCLVSCPFMQSLYTISNL